MVLPKDPVKELMYALLLLIMVVGSIALTRRVYRIMVKLGVKHNVVVYYNRKIIHMVAGGVTALLVPLLFSSPLIPFLFAVSLGYAIHRVRRRSLMGWFQTPDNSYEVNFCFAWGLSLLVLWLVTANPYYAVIPPLMISFGDAITGVIRNIVYGRRTKSWYGSLGMLAVSVLIGYYYAGNPGIVAGVVSTLVERFEIPPYLDDNVLIVTASTITLLAFYMLGLLPC